MAGFVGTNNVSGEIRCVIVPYLSSSMLESHHSHGKVWDNIVHMDDPLIVGETVFRVITEDLVSSSWATEGVEEDLVHWVQLLFYIEGGKLCEGRSKGVTSHIN